MAAAGGHAPGAQQLLWTVAALWPHCKGSQAGNRSSSVPLTASVVAGPDLRQGQRALSGGERQQGRCSRCKGAKQGRCSNRKRHSKEGHSAAERSKARGSEKCDYGLVEGSASRGAGSKAWLLHAGGGGGQRSCHCFTQGASPVRLDAAPCCAAPRGPGGTRVAQRLLGTGGAPATLPTS